MNALMTTDLYSWLWKVQARIPTTDLVAPSQEGPATAGEPAGAPVRGRSARVWSNELPILNLVRNYSPHKSDSKQYTKPSFHLLKPLLKNSLLHKIDFKLNTIGYLYNILVRNCLPHTSNSKQQTQSLCYLLKPLLNNSCFV